MEDILRFANDPKTLILKEIIKILNDSNKISFKNFLCRIPSISKKIGLVLFAFFITNNFELLSNKFIFLTKIILKYLFYKKYIFHKNDVEYSYFSSCFINNRDNTLRLNYNNLEVYVNRRTNLISLHASEYLHSELFEDINLYKTKIQKTISVFKTFNNGKLIEKKPMRLFDSKNYIKLMKNIDTFVYQSKNIDMITTLSMIIDGEPGLGKTKFSEYICHKKSDITGKKIFNDVYLIDMAKSIDTDYENIFNISYFDVNISGPTLFVIDEIDKYLSHKTLEEYKYHKDECRIQKIKPDNYSDFKNVYKRNFLNWLLKIIERSGEKYPIVVIFCCNNFSDIFSGIDMKHYESLVDRILVQTFERCDTQETKSYLEYLNSKMGTDYSIDIDFKVDITFRNLFQITVLENYHIPDIINRIKNPKKISFSLKESNSINDIIDEEIIDDNEIEEIEDIDEEIIEDCNTNFRIEYNDNIYSFFCMYSVECLEKPTLTIKETNNHIKLLVCKKHYNDYIRYGEKYLGYVTIMDCVNCERKKVLFNTETKNCIYCEEPKNKKQVNKSIFCCHYNDKSIRNDFSVEDNIEFSYIYKDKCCCLECKNMFQKFVYCYNCNYLGSVDIPYESLEDEDGFKPQQIGFVCLLNKDLKYNFINFKPLIYLCFRCEHKIEDIEKNIRLEEYFHYFQKNYILKKLLNIAIKKEGIELIKKSNLCNTFIDNINEIDKNKIIKFYERVYGVEIENIKKCF